MRDTRTRTGLSYEENEQDRVRPMVPGRIAPGQLQRLDGVLQGMLLYQVPAAPRPSAAKGRALVRAAPVLSRPRHRRSRRASCCKLGLRHPRRGGSNIRSCGEAHPQRHQSFVSQA